MEIVIVFIAIAAFVVGHFIGYERGFRDGEEYGRLIQHGLEKK